MDEKTKRNVRFFALYKILHEPLFWGPILISYIINVGKMDLPSIYYMESTVVFGLIIAEVYSSAWADILSRRYVIIAGSAMSVAAMIVFILATSPLLIWISNIMIMIAVALCSGVDEAYLADALNEVGEYGRYLKINGRIMSWRYAAIAFCSIASGYLYAIDPRLPLIVSLPGMLISLGAAIALSEPKRTGRTSHKDHFNLMKLSFFFVANHSRIKWIIGYIAVLTAASKLWFFTYNPYFETVGLDPKFYGWIFFFLNLVAWLTSRYAEEIGKKIGECAALALMPLFIGLPIMGMGLFLSQFAVLFILAQNLIRGFQEPFFSSFINRHLESANRATVLSLRSAASALTGAASLWGFGLLLDRTPLAIGLQILGAVVLTFGAYGIYRYTVIFRRTTV